MPSNGFPLHPGYRHGPPPGLAPLDEDVNDEGAMEMRNVQVAEKNEKKMPEPEVHEVPSNEPIVVSWDGPDDPHNPQNFSNSRKWVITAVCCALTVNATFASSAPSIAGVRLIERFNISEEVSELVTVLFLMGYVLGPVFWGSGSEMFGRRYVLLLAMCSYTILFIGQGVATNIQTVLILRFFSGAFAVAPLITSGGILADIWNAQGRGYATSLFGGCVFLGPSLGPLIGGFVAADPRLGWEWIYWVMMIFAGACTLFAIVCLPETYGPILLTRKAIRLRNEDPIGNGNLLSDHEKLDSSFHGILERTLYRPWKMMAKEPILILITVYMSVVYGILYALFEAFPVIFVEKRGFTVTQQGLLFIGIGIGSVLTTFMNLYFAKQVNKIIPKWKGFPPAELRLYSAMIGSVMLVISSFWLGWTGNYASIPWYVPGISTVFVGMAISAIFTSLITYIVDTYLLLAASALASNTMIRSLVGSVFPLFTVQMYHNLGINWASTLIALICLLLSPIPFLFFKYGARIRQHSKFAPCLDLKIAKQIQEQEEAQVRGQSSFYDFA
ncbi:MFS polyamine transporter [Lentinula detonsa]|uniref:MFS polyamine transporter n=1 Tax=Lentinula detonsa TaxID=2804962 RepID=A0AA38PXQ1_9AGAR|nr:MFS polyamine transporter [Lentinula detonsa]